MNLGISSFSRSGRRPYPSHEGEREQVTPLASAIQEVTGESMTVIYADQGYTGAHARADAAAAGIELQIIRQPEVIKGFVLLPKRWFVERSIAWAARFQRLSRDYERLPQTVAGFHELAYRLLMMQKAFAIA